MLVGVGTGVCVGVDVRVGVDGCAGVVGSGMRVEVDVGVDVSDGVDAGCVTRGRVGVSVDSIGSIPFTNPLRAISVTITATPPAIHTKVGKSCL